MKIKSTTNFNLDARRPREQMAMVINCSLQIDAIDKKEANILRRKEEISTKIEKLKEELTNLQNNLDIVQKSKKTSKETLEVLQNQFDITEIRLQEAKLDLIKRNITEQNRKLLLQKQLIQEDDTIIDIESS